MQLLTATIELIIKIGTIGTPNNQIMRQAMENAFTNEQVKAFAVILVENNNRYSKTLSLVSFVFFGAKIFVGVNASFVVY